MQRTMLATLSRSSYCALSRAFILPYPSIFAAIVRSPASPCVELEQKGALPVLKHEQK